MWEMVITQGRLLQLLNIGQGVELSVFIGL